MNSWFPEEIPQKNPCTAARVLVFKSGPTWARTKDHLIMSQVL
jgi:hypothetical protein